MKFIPDIMRRFRMPASAGSDQYLRIHNLAQITVGVLPMPLIPGRLSVTLVLCQATIGNAGIIYIGGPETSAANGIELDGGRGVLFTAGPGGLTPQQLMLGGMGFSILQRYEELTPPDQSMVRSMVGGEEKRTVINLHDVWAVASIPAQTMRILYMLPMSDV
jgi:hypothetical protein